jgi:hypothetical protein
MAAVAAYRGHSLLYSLPNLSTHDPIFDGAERDEIDEALGVGGHFEVGKRAAMPPLPGPSQGFEREPRTYEEMWAVHRAEVAKLREHLLSLAGGISKVQSDIAGRAGRGWYEVFDRMPFNPWRPQQMGSRPKPNGKYRVIVNASFPHSELADDYGVRTHSLNSLSKRSYDAVRGSDGKRMCRMLAMVRVTALSPPPRAGSPLEVGPLDWPAELSALAASGAVAPSPATAFAPRLGKVRVERAEGTHPWSVSGGAGSLLDTPFYAAGPDQQGAVPGDSSAARPSVLRLPTDMAGRSTEAAPTSGTSAASALPSRMYAAPPRAA